MFRAIVTHPGGAHKDDLLAVCLLIAKHPVPVFRRDPTPEELDDPEVAIVDVGGSHDASRLNFDHHHFPREHPPTCALSLVLDHFGLYRDALQFCDWLEPAEWFDSRGPTKTAESTRETVSPFFTVYSQFFLPRAALGLATKPVMANAANAASSQNLNERP